MHLLVCDHILQNWHRLTQLLELSLVALATGDGLLLRLGSGGLGLNGGNPAVTLSSVGSLEGVLGAVSLEEELVGALLGDVGSISLHSLAVYLVAILHLNDSYQVENDSRGALVLGALGQEQQTLTGLGSPGSGSVSNSGLLVLAEDVEVLGLDGIVAEVQETLGEAQTPELDLLASIHTSCIL